MKIVVCVMLFLMIQNEIVASPFLFNSGRSIISSIFSSSSSGGANADGNSNIEDLRVKHDKEEDHRQHKEEGHLNRRAAIDEETMNEAMPNIVHKKLSKILNKLQAFSTIRRSINENMRRNQERESNDANDPELVSDEDNEIDRDNIKLLVSNSSEPVNNVQKVTSRTMENKFVLYPEETTTTDSLLEFVTEQDEELLRDSPFGGKISLTPGSIGLYFIELLGSIATLIYGAALTVSNAVNNSSNSV